MPPVGQLNDVLSQEEVLPRERRKGDVTRSARLEGGCRKGAERYLGGSAGGLRLKLQSSPLTLHQRKKKRGEDPRVTARAKPLFLGSRGKKGGEGG